MIYLCAGEGGHLEQAKRFLAKASSIDNNHYVLFTDFERDLRLDHGDVRKLWPISRYSKSNNVICRFYSLFLTLLITVIFLFKFIFARPAGVVLFGPLLCAPMGLAAKLTRVPVVFIETWSRFDTPSKTGVLLSKLNVDIYYQNKSLDYYYGVRNGKYSGRL